MKRPLYLLVVLALLGEMAFAMVTTAIQQSPTIDEPVYVATAEVLTEQHSLRYNPEHPPLGKLIIASGLAFGHSRLDPAFVGNQTRLGRHLLYETGNNPFNLMLLARLPMIALTLLFGLVVLAFARDLAGPWAGLIALALYAFSPDVIAHGSLATLDMPAAGMLLTTFWLAWRARKAATSSPTIATTHTATDSDTTAPPGTAATGDDGGGAARDGATHGDDGDVPGGGKAHGGGFGWGRGGAGAVAGWRAGLGSRLYLPLAGVALGAALATRMSALPAVPLLLLLIFIPTTKPSRKEIGRYIGQRALWALSVGVIAVGVVWLVYLAVDPRLRWTTPTGVTNPGGLRGLAVDLLPLPKAYRDGILIQFRLEARNWNGFLLGRAYRGSLWYYLPVALLIKTPIGMLLLWLAGAVTMLVQPALRVATLYLLLPAGVLMLVAMAGSRDYGTRYVIFMPIFLAVVSGTVAAIGWRWARAGSAALVAYVAVSSALTFPFYLPYSNEAFGGTANTHNNLHDANVDWGQDLGRLGTRLRERYPGETVWLIYKGSGAPAYYGIQSRNPYSVPNEQVHGLLAVSDSRVALATGRLKQLLATSTPIDQVGYSITIFRR